MISPHKALRLITRHSSTLGVQTIGLDEALGYVLAENVRSPIALPRFDNSAMDGFAVRSSDTARATTGNPVMLSIGETVFAGDLEQRSVRKNATLRIMTGAPVPRGADAVIPVEQAMIDGGQLVVKRSVPRLQHVRRQGEEVAKGRVVLKAGVVINPGTIACLATVGKAQVRVTRKPRVAIVGTGDETVMPGERLLHGQIYDSNTHMISAMLRQMGIEPVRVRRVKDHRTALTNAVRAALRSSDVLVVIGGVSVGDRDYLRSVLESLRVQQVFWRVAQKPGKPLYFGTRGKRVVFGLPGNPASAFTCFYAYVYPALRHMAGYPKRGLATGTLPIADGVKPDPQKWRLLKARTQGHHNSRVSELPHQGSHMITSLSETNSLIVVPPESDWDKNSDTVQTIRLPYIEEGD